MSLREQLAQADLKHHARIMSDPEYFKDWPDISDRLRNVFLMRQNWVLLTVQQWLEDEGILDVDVFADDAFGRPSKVDPEHMPS